MRMKRCVYMNLARKMLEKDIDTGTLANQVFISYPSLRRKMRGMTKFTLEEAQAICAAVGDGMTIEELFAR